MNNAGSSALAAIEEAKRLCEERRIIDDSQQEALVADALAETEVDLAASVKAFWLQKFKPHDLAVADLTHARVWLDTVVPTCSL